jgi:hypothetical protein
MPGTLARKSKRSRRLRWPALLSVLALSFSAPITTATTEVEGASLSIGAETLRRPAPIESMVAPRAGKILKEIGKQAIDQPAHFMMAAAPIWLSRHLVGVPWYGWAAAPLLAYREWLQWPSNRWWDPPLDWAFLTIGMVVATWSRGLAQIVSIPARSIRQARRARGRGEATRHDLQCSRRIRIPAMTSRMPVTSVRLGRSWKKKTAAVKVNTSSIWPSART